MASSFVYRPVDSAAASKKSDDLQPAAPTTSTISGGIPTDISSHPFHQTTHPLAGCSLETSPPYHSSSSTLCSTSQLPPCSTSEEEFLDVPVQCLCRHCGAAVLSHVEIVTSWVTCILALVCFLLLGWISICVLPFLWPVLQDSVHTCPLCQNELSRRRRVSVPSFGKDVVTVRCGTCAVVLSRLYVFVLAGMSAVILIVYGGRWYLKHVGLPEIAKGETVDDSWGDFLQNCGVRTSFGNPIRAVEMFRDRYDHKTINWSGRVNRIREGIWTKNFLFVDMHPSQFRSAEMADLGLMFGANLTDVVKHFKPGDRVDFEATMVELGRRGNPHFGVLWAVTKREDQDDDMMAPSAFLAFNPLNIIQQLMLQMNNNNNVGVVGGRPGGGQQRRVVVVGDGGAVRVFSSLSDNEADSGGGGEQIHVERKQLQQQATEGGGGISAGAKVYVQAKPADRVGVVQMEGKTEQPREGNESSVGGDEGMKLEQIKTATKKTTIKMDDVKQRSVDTQQQQHIPTTTKDKKVADDAAVIIGDGINPS
eukprot:GHVS01004475.1.p1 GENE.GHVS01004475.1~~GHVS01004475.1.p1  ORF type:complete len:535 (+),score=110.71 GHVS01004475.1:109-1713(+)